MVEKIYIARHGFRLNWVTTNWQSKTGLPRDPPLAAYGEAQAQELGDYFSSLPKEEQPTAIFSSPYYRCLQTAKPVSIALDIPIYVEHGISEWYSPVVPGSGLHPRPGSASSLQAYFSEIDPSWSTIWYPSRKGEDIAEVHTRIDDFLGVFIPEVSRRYFGKHSRILLVSHAATVITLARSLLGNRDLPLRVGCCSLSEFTRTPNTGERTASWMAVRLADGSHLKDGTSRDWGFEDVETERGRVVNDPGVAETEDEEDEPIGSQLIPLSSNL